MRPAVISGKSLCLGPQLQKIDIPHIDIATHALYNISTHRSEVRDGSLLCQVQIKEGGPEPSGHHNEER